MIIVIIMTKITIITMTKNDNNNSYGKIDNHNDNEK